MSWNLRAPSRALIALTALALLTGGCALQSSPYPLPEKYAAADAVPPTVLTPPPAQYSAEYQREIDVILARQPRLTAGEIAAIRAERGVTPEMIVTPVLGERVNAQSYPKLFALLKQAGSDSWRISDQAKEFWGSLRPWRADARVALLVPYIDSPGYPSGHTTTNFVWAALLSDVVPAKRAAFQARAAEIGRHRIEAGAHFPHDIAGGIALAARIVAVMRQCPQFAHDLRAAQQEWRQQHHPVAARKAA